MCGIVAARSLEAVEHAVNAMGHRGPDGFGYAFADIADEDGWVLGHTRLSILDLSDAASQPFEGQRVTVTYNGELWNYEDLRGPAELGSSGDTAVLADHLSRGRPLAQLDGQFGFAYFDHDDRSTLRVVRDRLGEVPLHWAWMPDGSPIIASELKALAAAGAIMSTARWVPPGVEMVIVDNEVIFEAFACHDPEYFECDDELRAMDDPELLDALLAAAVAKRTTVSDVPVAALCSGGIDSTAVIWHMLKHQPVVAYTAVFDPKSRDLRCARQACEMLGVELREVKIEAPTLEDLETVVRMIEMPHKAQVEIGWLCLGLARQIHEDGFKVLLSGEGADELFASYGNAYFGVKDKGWRGFRSESVIGQHRKNWARVNKVFMAYSIEGRLPFADAEVVAYGLTLPQSAVEPGGRTKGVLRDKYLGRVPDSVVNRPKAAFQTEAKITDAIPAADPTRFYRATFRSQFQGAKP